MKMSAISDEMRKLGDTLRDKFKENYLGSREDRDELTYWVMPGSWRESAAFIRDTGYEHLSDLTAVDYLDRDPRFDVMAIFSHPETHRYIRLKTVVGEDEPVDSLSELWPGADWMEREIFDLFGISFNDHPNLKRILLPDDYVGHPLRKDYPVTGPAGSQFR